MASGTRTGCRRVVHWPQTAFWEMAPPCTCRESPCDQENTRCWKMTVARGSEMKAQIEPWWKPTVDKIVAVESLQEHQESTGRNRCAGLARGRLPAVCSFATGLRSSVL